MFTKKTIFSLTKIFSGKSSTLVKIFALVKIVKLLYNFPNLCNV